MRLYLPATTADLLPADSASTAATAATSSAAAVPPRPLTALASAVTPALRRALPQEDEEGMELSAFLTAADLSALAVAETPGLPARRVVISAEVPAALAATARSVPADLADLPSLVGTVTVDWRDVVAIHIDDAEPATAELVRRAAREEEALAELGEVDLLWYHPSELAQVRAALGP